jgi:hypothetical protein
MWISGEFTINGCNFRYDAKVFEEGSQFGINNGRISKLEIWDKDTNEVVVNYDRGWDIYPGRNLDRQALNYVLELYK